MFLHGVYRQRSGPQSNPSESIKGLKLFTVYAVDLNFNLFMVGGSNAGRGTRPFNHSDHARSQHVDLCLGNAF